MIRGKIIKQISNDYTVRIDNLDVVCKSRGKFRKLGITPLVGDNAFVDLDNHYIMDIDNRKNSLIRPSIANVDQAIIVMSNKIPSFSLELLDKLLCIISFNAITPIIYVSKIDLLNESEKKSLMNILDYYQKFYRVYIDTKIREVFKDKISVFVGQSGAGKSTLLNKLDRSLNLKTDDVSVALGRGKHTTRHVELLDVLGGLIADTPGFSKLSLDMSPSDIRDNFFEFNYYRKNCEYKDCMHDKENVCEIKRQVELGNILKSRYENYIKFMREVTK